MASTRVQVTWVKRTWDDGLLDDVTHYLLDSDSGRLHWMWEDESGTHAIIKLSSTTRYNYSDLVCWLHQLDDKPNNR